MTEPRRGRPRAPETDTAILDAALELFLERGVEGTSMEQVAKRAGVAKLTVYRRWSTKEDLIAQAIEYARVRMTADSDISAADLGDAPVRTLLAESLPRTADSLAQPGLRALIAGALGITVSHPALARVYWERHSRPRRDVTRALLERAKAEGLLPAGTDCDVVIDMIIGAVTHRLLQPDPPDAAQLREYLAALYRQLGLL